MLDKSSSGGPGARKNLENFIVWKLGQKTNTLCKTQKVGSKYNFFKTIIQAKA